MTYQVDNYPPHADAVCGICIVLAGSWNPRYIENPTYICNIVIKKLITSTKMVQQLKVMLLLHSLFSDTQLASWKISLALEKKTLLNVSMCSSFVPLFEKKNIYINMDIDHLRGKLSFCSDTFTQKDRKLTGVQPWILEQTDSIFVI